MPRPILYKYRSLENFEFFVDILVNQQLYATTYPNMNDAMEGIYYHLGLTPKILREIKKEKDNLMICSLSKKMNDPLLWAHYANGSRGVNLKVEITANYVDIKEIDYTDLPAISTIVNAQKTAKEILTHKHESWKYEDEVRVFTDKPTVKVLIRQIILGERISPKHRDLVKALTSKLLPDVQIIEFEDLF